MTRFRGFFSTQKQKLIRIFLVCVSVVSGLVLLWFGIDLYHKKLAADENELHKLETITTLNDLVTLKPPVGFYYIKSKSLNHQKVVSEIVEFRPLPQGGFSTSTLFVSAVPEAKSIYSVLEGRNGADSVVGLELDRKIVFLKGVRQQGDLAITSYPAKRYEASAVSDSLVVSGNKHELLMNDYDNNAYSAVLRDFNGSTTRMIANNLPAPVKYFDTEHNRLFLGIAKDNRMCPALYSYDIDTGRLQEIIQYEDDSKTTNIKNERINTQCDKRNPDAPVGVTTEGKYILAHFESRYGPVSSLSLLDLKSIPKSNKEVYVQKLPFEQKFNQSSFLFSPDGKYMLNQEYYPKDKINYDSFRLGTYNFISEIKITDLQNYTAHSISKRIIGDVDSPFYSKISRLLFASEESYVYFEGLGLGRYLSDSSDVVIAWLDDNRFLIRKDGNLYVDDLRGNKTLVDTGSKEYGYLGSVVVRY